MSNTLDAIKRDIAKLESAMKPNKELAAQLAAMQDAVSALAQQEYNLDALRGQLAEAERAEAARKAAVERYSIISIYSTVEGTPKLTDTRTVRFNERIYGLNGTEWREGRMPLHGCTQELWAAILADPSKIPADISALDADPAAAVHLHAKFCRQGYVSA